MTGTLVNTAAIVAGSLAGIVIRSRLPSSFTRIMFQGIGLFTVVVGISMSIGYDNLLLSVVSIVTGGLAGKWIGINRRVDNFCTRLLAKSRGFRPGSPLAAADVFGDTRPVSESGMRESADGFVTATMIFCVGSMAILGAVEDGLGNTPTLLYTKSIMDGITSLVLAASFGAWVMFSAIPVLVYQGAITLMARYASLYLTAGMTAGLTSVGGIILVGMGITILKIKKIEVLDMLPALAIILILCYFWG
ncbi:MAG: DUF554 domain-containing protein [Rikenellaceae bacterium]|nr:DUF554 domain-containing protein [Rikenellaceae bacterium]